MKKIKRVLVYGSTSFLKKNETKSLIKYLSRKCTLVDIFTSEDLNKPNSKKYDLILSIGGDGIFLSASLVHIQTHTDCRFELWAYWVSGRSR